MFTIKNFVNAFYRTKKGKRDKRKIFLYEVNLILNLKKLMSKIETGTFEVRYNEFKITENGKIRVIRAPDLESCIVQQVLYHTIYDTIDNKFIDNSFACRKGKGIHLCKQVTYNNMRKFNKNKYFLQMDIKKFFYSIDQVILATIINNKYIKDRRLLSLLFLFIIDKNVNSEFIGLPIGNLISQIMANVYMNEVDIYLTNKYPELFYTRYMDDFVLFGINTYSESLAIKNDLEIFIKNNLGLKLSKFKIDKLNNGINYAGYRIKHDSIILRKRQYVNFEINKENPIILNSIMSMSKNTTSRQHFLNKIKIEKENQQYDY